MKIKIRNKDLVATVETMISSDVILAKWSRNRATLKNWGDALNLYLISKISNKKVIHINDVVNVLNRPVYSVIGSVLDNNRTSNLVVWGTGMKSDQSPIYTKPALVTAVRGPLTRNKLLSLGVTCPEVYGDPALLLPAYYKPTVKKKFKLGVVPHYLDKGNVNLSLLEQTPGVKVLDIESDIEVFIDDLCACEFIASSSLHGLIAADAYGIPRVWLQFSNKIAGGDYKFNDYFLSVDTPETKALQVNHALTIDEIFDAYRGQSPKVATDSLWAACPFKQ